MNSLISIMTPYRLIIEEKISNLALFFFYSYLVISRCPHQGVIFKTIEHIYTLPGGCYFLVWVAPREKKNLKFYSPPFYRRNRIKKQERINRRFIC